MKKNVIKSFMSLFLSAILLISGLGLTVHASIDGPPSVDSAQEGLSDSGGSLRGSGGISLYSSTISDNLVTGFSMTVVATDGVTETEIKDGENYTFERSEISSLVMNYRLSIPESLQIPAGDSYKIVLPGFFDETMLTPKDIVAEERIVATYTIKNGEITIIFTDNVNDLDKKLLDVTISGNFITSIFDTEEEVLVNIPFATGSSFEAKLRLEAEDYKGVDSKKASVPYVVKDTDGNPIGVERDPEFMDWTVIVNDNMDSLSNAVAFDDLGDNLEIVLNSIKVYKLTRNYKNETIKTDLVSDLTPQKTGSGFEVALGTISEAYMITYTTRLIRPEKGGNVTIKNSAGLRYEDGNNDIAPVEKEVTWSEDLPTIKKEGKLTNDPNIINWEIKYNFKKENFNQIILTDELDYGVIDTNSIRVYEVNEIGTDGEIISEREIENFTTVEDEDGNLTFPLDAENIAYRITFSSTVPVGLKGNVTNTITDNWTPNPNSASDSVPVNTIPTGGKIGQQKVDDEGNPYIEWTITLNSEKVDIEAVRLADIFNPEMLVFDPSDKSLFEMYRYDDSNEEWNLVEAGYSVSEYIDPENGRTGFRLDIDTVGPHTYKFVYRTYYTMKGMQQPYTANIAEIFFIKDDGSGIGPGPDPITATIEGPIASISKSGMYLTSEDKNTQTIQWRIVLNESKINLDYTKTEIVDTFTSGNYTYIPGTLVITNENNVQLVSGVDYKFQLTDDGKEPPKQTGFIIKLLEDTEATLTVTYETTVDDANNGDHVNEVDFTWQGGTESDEATVKARKPGISKSSEIEIDEYGNKTVKWSISFNNSPSHVLYDVEITDTYAPAGAEINDIKLYRGSSSTPLTKDAANGYTLIGPENGSFTIKISKLDAVPYKITYSTVLSAEDENEDIANSAKLTYRGGEEDPVKETVNASKLAVAKYVDTTVGDGGIDKNSDPRTISWVIKANATAGKYLKTLNNALLEDTIPEDQKLVKDSIIVEKVRFNGDYSSGNLLDITSSLIISKNDNYFSFVLPPGAFQYLVSFKTEILEYPSATVIEGKDYPDRYVNNTTLTNEHNDVDKRDAVSDDAWVEYFGSDKSGLVNKSGDQNSDTENIDWKVNINSEGLTIHKPVITDTISSNQTYIENTIKVWTTYDESKDNYVGLDSKYYNVGAIHTDGEGKQSFTITFVNVDNPNEDFILKVPLIITYSTRLLPDIIGGNITVRNEIVLNGGTEGKELVRIPSSTTAKQWFYGGGGSGTNVEFGFIKQSPGPKHTPLPNVGFKLEYQPFSGSLQTLAKITTSSETNDLGGYSFSKPSYDKLRAGRYILTETDAPAGYIANDPIYFAVGYTADPDQYLITLMTVNNEGVWSIDEADSYNNIVSVDGNHMTITNNYKPLAVELKASKLLEDKKLTESELSFVFELFQVVDGDENSIALVHNGSDGKVVFKGGTTGTDEIPELQFDEVGDYIFYIREVPNGEKRFNFDDTTYKVVVEVKESDKGLTTDVTYYRLSNDEAGEIIEIKLADSEIPVFNNYYSANLVLKAKKILQGRRLREGEFKFSLTPWNVATGNSINALNGTSAVSVVANDAEGLVSFPKITFDKAGDYYYIIEELPGNVGGVVYDKNAIIVKVEVAYNVASGQLEATIKGYHLGEDGLPGEDLSENDFIPAENELPTFTNRYTAAPNVAIIEARKVLAGKDLAADQFSFELLDGNGKLIETVKNKADGHINFAEITYYSAGEYNYTIREVKGSAAGITYDETEHKVTVMVTDDGRGQLHAEVIYKDNKTPTFTNTYKAAATSATVTAHKTLTGKTLTANQFSFELVDKDGKVLETVKNKADGSISFTALNFDTAGENSYTIREVKGKETGIIYDRTEYKVTVKVTDDQAGKLQAEVVYAQGKAPTFTNRFSKEDTGSQIPTEPDDGSEPDLPHTGEGRSTSALGLALILAGLALGLFAWLQQRPRKRYRGQE